jgi:hypothetical protein
MKKKRDIRMIGQLKIEKIDLFGENIVIHNLLNQN